MVKFTVFPKSPGSVESSKPWMKFGKMQWVELERYDEIWWGMVRFSKIWWDFIRFYKILWLSETLRDLIRVRYGDIQLELKIQWYLVKFGEIFVRFWYLMRYGEIWYVVRIDKIQWDSLRYGEIWWDSVRYGEILQDLMRFWRILNLVRLNEIWWDSVRYDEIW